MESRHNGELTLETKEGSEARATHTSCGDRECVLPEKSGCAETCL